ncbi:constituent of pre-ribosomal particles [Scheffersomyces coipomensis]|uniref:constituent of pre-ribosomal particles n=1 Tax=Scheffersomyces coipomensis TaxID=1788519 RepID=UPI00315C8EA8
MSNSLEERLKTHSSAFDGLLSLIPAKYYYDDATQDQWKQKKKSSQELADNKRSKLDPDSKKNADDYVNGNATAKDVMDNKASKAKRVVLPGSKVKPAQEPVQEDDEEEEEEEESKEVDDESNSDDSDDFIHEESAAQLVFDDDGNEIEINDDDSNTSDVNDEQEFKKQKVQNISTKKNGKSLSPEEQLKREENLKNLREKLANKISTLKEKRKAPGTKGNGVVKSREQILEERKRKEELKKELKRKRREQEEEDEDDDGEENSDDERDEDDDQDKSVLFGNIVFNDGSRVTSDLTKLRNTADKKKQKGPANKDIKGHLQKLEHKKRKLATLSEEDQAKQQQKEKWQRVMNQAEGIKVKDDEKLLKKALKRKEKQKLKSEIEWRERKQVVKDTVDARSKRREENLKSRRDNKGKKSKNQPRLKKFTGIVNKAAKKRAGFEGSAKSKKKN